MNIKSFRGRMLYSTARFWLSRSRKLSSVGLRSCCTVHSKSYKNTANNFKPSSVSLTLIFLFHFFFDVLFRPQIPFMIKVAEDIYDSFVQLFDFFLWFRFSLIWQLFSGVRVEVFWVVLQESFNHSSIFFIFLAKCSDIAGNFWIRSNRRLHCLWWQVLV